MSIKDSSRYMLGIGKDFGVVPDESFMACIEWDEKVKDEHGTTYGHGMQTIPFREQEFLIKTVRDLMARGATVTVTVLGGDEAMSEQERRTLEAAIFGGDV